MVVWAAAQGAARTQPRAEAARPMPWASFAPAVPRPERALPASIPHILFVVLDLITAQKRGEFVLEGNPLEVLALIPNVLPKLINPGLACGECAIAPLPGSSALSGRAWFFRTAPQGIGLAAPALGWALPARWAGDATRPITRTVHRFFLQSINRWQCAGHQHVSRNRSAARNPGLYPA